MALGLVGEDPGEVLAHQQTGDARRAAEELVVHGNDPHVGPVETAEQRLQHPRAVGAREDAHRHVAGGSDLEELVGGGPRPTVRLVVGLGRPRCVGPREEPVLLAGGVDLLAEQLELEGAGHPHAVLVHGEVVVHVGSRERTVGEQVVLVAHVDEAPAERGEVDLLPLLHPVDHRGGLGDRVGAHAGLGVVAADPERHHAERGQLRVPVEDAGQGAFEHVAVVDAGTHHHLAVDLDPVVEEGP